MSDDVQVANVLDLKGLACPMPVVKVSKGIKDVEVGEVIEAHTTDPGALTDFPAWAVVIAVVGMSLLAYGLALVRK